MGGRLFEAMKHCHWRVAALGFATIFLIVPIASATTAQQYAQAPAPVDPLPPSPIEISENPGKATQNKSDEERRAACGRHRSAKGKAIGGPSDAAILDQAIEIDCPN